MDANRGLFILFFLSLLLFNHLSPAQTIRQGIDKNWQFRQVGKEDWLPASVPGTVHTDLLANNKIADPFYRTNEKDEQWIENEDWEYKTSFEVNGIVFAMDRVELLFNGLDTYADIYLNGKLIYQADNMFRSWHVPVDHYLREGENELRVVFHSPIKAGSALYDRLTYTLPVSSNDQADKKVSIFTRKAPYHYGWDWGPRLVTSGIWRPVELVAWKNARIADVFALQKEVEADKALYQLETDIEATRTFFGDLKIYVDDNLVRTDKVDLSYGKNANSVRFEIRQPELWWPNGYGKQKLYTVRVDLVKEDEVIDSFTRKIGVRTVELIQQPDKTGTSFYFKVNGVPMFMKGANYIPQDNFLPRVTPQRYEHILQSAADAHMNMIRVWGGGIYENDLFYQLCDEKGLLVWQDFMFSCAMYPGLDDFLDNVQAEAAENVRRLRNHPCMALWCGNNEVLMKWQGWRHNANKEGHQEPLWSDPSDSIRIVDAYHQIFEVILPAAVRQYDAGAPYWESSPSSTGGDYEDWKSGDSHYWGVWWGQEPFSAYRDHIGRFMTEYGFQSFPELKTVKAYTIPEDWDIYSDVMKAHQRSSIGNGTIEKYMNNNFRKPKDFQHFLYVGQLLQAEGVKVAMEAHRIAKPSNMGSLFWQLDDCWPVASWSSIDYFGRWKALHYYAKRAFSDVLVAPEFKNEQVEIHVVSDRLKAFTGKLILAVYDFSGKELYTHSQNVKIPANSSEVYLKLKENEFNKNFKAESAYLKVALLEHNQIISDNRLFFKPFKDLLLEDPGLDYDVHEENGQKFVTIVAKNLAIGIYLSALDDLKVNFSDNYFDLDPGTVCKIKLTTNANIQELTNKIQVISLYDSYEHGNRQ